MSRKALEIKQRLRRGEVVFCAWLTFNDSGIAEVLAGTGFDVILIDTEHTSITLENLQHAIAAMSRWDPVVIVRVQNHDPSRIKRILDVGADGIIAPMTMNAEQAAALVQACKYAPLGRRGYGPRRATDYFRDTERYVAAANDATFVIPQLEHIDAAERAREIAAVPGVDALCQGPWDLSATAGLLGQVEHPRVVAALDRIFDAAREAGLPVCMGYAAPPAQQPHWVAKGARMVIASDDLIALREGVAGHLRETRALLGKTP